MLASMEKMTIKKKKLLLLENRLFSLSICRLYFSIGFHISVQRACCFALHLLLPAQLVAGEQEEAGLVALEGWQRLCSWVPSSRRFGCWLPSTPRSEGLSVLCSRPEGEGRLLGPHQKALAAEQGGTLPERGYREASSLASCLSESRLARAEGTHVPSSLGIQSIWCH